MIVILAPGGQLFNDGHKRFSKLRKGIFRFGRNHRIELAPDHAVVFQLTQLAAEHARRGNGQQTLQLAVSQGFADQFKMIRTLYLPPIMSIAASMAQ